MASEGDRNDVRVLASSFLQLPSTSSSHLHKRGRFRQSSPHIAVGSAEGSRIAADQHYPVASPIARAGRERSCPSARSQSDLGGSDMGSAGSERKVVSFRNRTN